MPRPLLRVLLAALALAAGQRSPADDATPPAEPAPLAALLARVQADFPGRVLRVELDDEDDAPSGRVYEVKILTGGGSVLEIEYDAASLAVLDIDGADDDDDD